MAGSGCNAYQIRKIYAIGGALGMVKRNEEDDLLHELVEGMTGKKSIKALTYGEACKVIGELEGRQGTPPPRKSGKPLRKTAPGHTSEGQRRKVWALMYRLQDPDPWAFNRCHYDAARKTLYIFDELTRLRTSNEETAKLVQQRIESWESVTADSAEMKSCADYRAFGILCREAVKGPGSVNQSMKWLQGLTAIVIDPHRCPDTAKEFSEYEYEVGRDGTVLPGYVDADNHHIDAVRYAVNRIWMRRGA